MTRWLFFSWFPFSHSTSYCICCSVVSVRQSTNITHRAKDHSIMGEAKSFIGCMDISDSKLLNEVMPFSIIYTSSHKKIIAEIKRKKVEENIALFSSYCGCAYHISQDTINQITRNVSFREAIIKTLITVHEGSMCIKCAPFRHTLNTHTARVNSH